MYNHIHLPLLPQVSLRHVPRHQHQHQILSLCIVEALEVWDMGSWVVYYVHYSRDQVKHRDLIGVTCHEWRTPPLE